MKVYLINRKDIFAYENDKILPLNIENGREYVEVKSNVVKFKRQSELVCRFWFLKALFFWIIGIMGLFTPRYSKFYGKLDCTVRLPEQGDEELMLRFNTPAGKNITNRFAFEILKGRVEGVDGGYYVEDAKARRRRKLYKLFSYLMRLAIIILTVLLIIK